ncbi:MAG TPA: hypothetical protein PLU53_07180 [Bacteroidia bacterium]|nr:hypothetical protein [Bacteroidia bacterium]
MFEHSTNRKQFIRILLLLVTLGFFSCSSDRQGDEIGALKNTTYPEIYEVRKNEIFISPNVRGPEDKSEFPQRIPTSWQKYANGSTNRMAILITDTTASWLGVAHGLKSIGIPFILTTDYRKALEHQVVMVYPVISGAALSPDALQALAAFPRNGGTLIGIQVLGALNEVFGFEEAVPSKQHFEISIKPDSGNVITGEFTEKNEMRISLGNKERFKETIGTYSYSKTQLPAIAAYEDKSTAISQRFYETGKAYAFGFDIGFLILKAHNNRHEDFNRSPINDFEPTIDVLLRILKNIYLDSDRNAATLCTVPYNKNLSVCITHNINFRTALEEAVGFAREEKKLGIHSSYFIQTKYIRDRSASIFNNNEDFTKLKELYSLGMDLQSNSVSGSPLFDQFEQGTGTEVYPDYRPYVMAWDKTYKGTIFGEMRVSRFLIDHFVPVNNSMCFRATHHYTPFTYPQSLLASGYRFSSSVSANVSLTHFPFQLNYNREYDSEMDAFEFPLTDDDEIPPYSIERAASAIRLAKKISRYGGCFIGQVHPNAIGLNVEKAFIKAMGDNAWYGTIRDFGLWWAARNEVTMDINQEGGRRVVVVNVPKRMEGLAIMLPIRSTPVSVEGGGKYSVDGKLIIFELAEGSIKIVLDN